MNGSLRLLEISDDDFVARHVARRPSIMALYGLLPTACPRARANCLKALAYLASRVQEPSLDTGDIRTLVSISTDAGATIGEELVNICNCPRDDDIESLHQLLLASYHGQHEVGGRDRLYLIALMTRFQRVARG